MAALPRAAAPFIALTTLALAAGSLTACDKKAPAAPAPATAASAATSAGDAAAAGAATTAGTAAGTTAETTAAAGAAAGAGTTAETAAAAGTAATTGTPAAAGNAAGTANTATAGDAAGAANAATAGSAAGAQAAPAAAPPAPTSAGAQPNDLPAKGPVKAPGKDSPEAVIMGAIQAAMNPDEAKGWAAFSALLHSSQQLPNSLTSWRTFNFKAFRRKVHLYLADDTKPDYVIDRVERPTPDRVKIFVHNERSMPTPCQLRKDPQAGGAWRIEICSL